MSTTTKTLGAIADEVLAIEAHRVAGKMHPGQMVAWGEFTRTSAPALARGVKELEAANEDLRERLRVAEDIIRSMPCDCRHDGDGMTATCNRCNALARIAAPVEVGQ